MDFFIHMKAWSWYVSLWDTEEEATNRMDLFIHMKAWSWYVSPWDTEEEATNQSIK